MAWKPAKRNSDDAGGNTAPTGQPVSAPGGGGGSGDNGGGSGSGGDGSGGGDWSDLFGAPLGSGGGSTPAGGSTGADDGDTPDDGYVYRDGKPVYNRDGSQRRKRGRNAGSKSSRKQKVPVASLSRFLAFAHMTMANVTKTPELEVSENEATMLANPMSEILGMYGVKIDPKVLAWMELAGAASYVYGPRIYMVRERLKQEKASKNALKGAPSIANTPPAGDVTQYQGVDISGIAPSVAPVQPTIDVPATFGIDGLQRGTFKGPPN